MNNVKISDSIVYIGCNDYDIDLFESQYVVPNGMAYNSYVILDEKIAVMDTADARVTDQWFSNLENALNGKTPDYLVIHHLEPDHAGNIKNFIEKYPNATLVGNAKIFNNIFDITSTVNPEYFLFLLIIWDYCALSATIMHNILFKASKQWHYDI